MILQKALSPAHTRLLVEGNQDTVAGYVVDAGEVARLTAAQVRLLFPSEKHGLDCCEVVGRRAGSAQ